jgi:hypothetical protein
MTSTAATIKSALCALSGSSGASFMKDNSGTCGITVVAISKVLNPSPVKQGVYMYAYRVTFFGDTLRGNVPQFKVKSSSVTYSVTPFTFEKTFSGDTVGDVSDATTGFGFEEVQGNQPSGTVALTYTCESKTVPVSVLVEILGTRITLTDSVPAVLELYQFVRLQTTYHQIIALPTSGTTVATISPPFFSAAATIVGGSLLTQAEYGVFYSDPTNNFGVSANCLSANQYVTNAVTPIDTAIALQTKIRALSQVINQDSNSIMVSRVPFLSTTATVGYTWTITFLKQNGEVPIVKCGTGALFGTNTASGASCVPTVTQTGSLIQGTFTLGQTFPHVLVGVPVLATTIAYPWNIDATSLAATLSAKAAFGPVAITRVIYIPTGHVRWAGGYLWTIIYTGRNGLLPAITPTPSLYASIISNTSVNLETGTERNLYARDDPGTAVTGNEVVGAYGLTFTDRVGRTYTSDPYFFPVVGANGQALSIVDFQRKLDQFLGNSSLTNTNVTRSLVPNSVQGFTYYITFIGQHVGGNVGPLVPITNNLIATATSTVVSKNVIVSESVVGAELKGSFQLRFNGFSTGALAFDADALSVQTALNNLASIAPSEVYIIPIYVYTYIPFVLSYSHFIPILSSSNSYTICMLGPGYKSRSDKDPYYTSCWICLVNNLHI